MTIDRRRVQNNLIESRLQPLGQLSAWRRFTWLVALAPAQLWQKWRVGDLKSVDPEFELFNLVNWTWRALRRKKIR